MERPEKLKITPGMIEAYLLVLEQEGKKKKPLKFTARYCVPGINHYLKIRLPQRISWVSGDAQRVRKSQR